MLAGEYMNAADEPCPVRRTPPGFVPHSAPITVIAAAVADPFVVCGVNCAASPGTDAAGASITSLGAAVHVTPNCMSAGCMKFTDTALLPTLVSVSGLSGARIPS